VFVGKAPWREPFSRREGLEIVTPSGNAVMASELKPAPPQVMVVEAEVAIRTVVADKLREVGLRVVEAANAEEASLYLKAGAPVDLVFRDIQVA
jgi:PleD family two-component response regulator